MLFRSSRLGGDTIHAALSPKFAIQIDGGGTSSVVDHPHDIWLLAVNVLDLGPMFQIGLAGAIAHNSISSAHRFCMPDEASDVVTALVGEFIDLGIRTRGTTRMRDLVRLVGADEIWRRSELRLGRPLSKFSVDRVRSEAIAARRAPFGRIVQRDMRYCAIGASPPLGRLDEAALAALAAIVDDLGVGEIRLTP